MAPKSARSPPSSGVPKHRACDECRSRKLACSKEPDGCSRCRREGIRCHYSPQKPMGRPRKRRHVQDDSPPRDVANTSSGPDDFAAGDDFVNVTRGDMPAYSGPGYDAQQGLVMDPALNFFDHHTGSAMDFLDLLPNPYPDAATGQPGHHVYLANQEPYDGSAFALHPSGVELLGDIDFDEPDPSAASVSKDFSDSLQRYMAAQYMQLQAEPPESTPSDMSTSVPSPEPAPPALKPIPTVSCGCLSSLYLAIDSLAHLPQGVTAAMRIARNASKVAHDVINCQYCAAPPDPSIPPPIQGFQNMMLLGALLPSACNAYATILEMVDIETALAKKEGRTFFFTFKDVGGLWGNMAEESSGACSNIQSYNNRTMEPDMWRATIRAIMRLDVYGFGDVADNPCPAYTQLGLKDVVTLLDQRSRDRHDLIDEMVASGQMPKTTPYMLFPGGIKSIPPEQRHCLRVIELARSALDNLVIA